MQSNDLVIQSNAPVIQSNDLVIQSNDPVIQSNDPVIQSNDLVIQSNAPVIQIDTMIHQINVPQIPLYHIFDEGIIPNTFLLNQAPITSGVFNVPKFLDDMRDSYKFKGMKNEDIDNFKLLLSAETDTLNDYLPISVLHEFGIRFGPWENIVEKVREFISDGARNWFIGKYNGTQAEEILSQKPDNCFSFRAVPLDDTIIPDHIYVFALSYRKNGRISHKRIFKDKQHRLCSLDVNQLRYFHSLKGIIELVLDKKSQPVGHHRFQGMKLVTVENITIEINSNNKRNYIPWEDKI